MRRPARVGQTITKHCPPHIGVPVQLIYKGTQEIQYRQPLTSPPADTSRPSCMQHKLNNVLNASHVQVHNANYPNQVIGCFAVGSTTSTDFVGNSVNSMNQIINIINLDASGNITVVVNGNP